MKNKVTFKNIEASSPVFEFFHELLQEAPANTIVGGVPAKFIKNIEEDIYVEN